jgi:hypothetical protein
MTTGTINDAGSVVDPRRPAAPVRRRVYHSVHDAIRGAKQRTNDDGAFVGVCVLFPSTLIDPTVAVSKKGALPPVAVCEENPLYSVCQWKRGSKGGKVSIESVVLLVHVAKYSRHGTVRSM